MTKQSEALAVSGEARTVLKTCAGCGNAFRVGKFEAKKLKCCSIDCRNLVRARFTLNFKERFWAKVRISEDDECWNWEGAISIHGYGQFSRLKRQAPAHRVSYELSIGQIPDGVCVLHKCDNRACCNPKHLFLGTIADNHADMDDKLRRHLRRKLTLNQAEQIKQLYGTGAFTQSQLGERFGVDQTTVSLILNEKTYQYERKSNAVRY